MSFHDFLSIQNGFTFAFPPEWAKAAMVLSFLGAGGGIGGFAYLNRYTRKPYFHLWTAAWGFFALGLVASIQLQAQPDDTFVQLIRQACIGCSAMCMFWGSFEMTGSHRNRRELVLAMGLAIGWSYVSTQYFPDRLWSNLPLTMLLGC